MALILFCILCPIGILWAVITAIRHIKLKAFSIYISNIFFSLAFSLDQLGNVVLSPFMNRWFITKDSVYKFGSIKHTISLVIAYNFREKTLTSQGSIFYFILESSETNHCEKAIASFENIQFKNNQNLI